MACRTIGKKFDVLSYYNPSHFPRHRTTTESMIAPSLPSWLAGWLGLPCNASDGGTVDRLCSISTGMFYNFPLDTISSLILFSRSIASLEQNFQTSSIIFHRYVKDFGGNLLEQ